MTPRLRLLAKVLAGVVLMLVLLIGAAIAFTQTSRFRNWARELAEQQAARRLNGQLAIARLDGDLWHGATLTGVSITQHGRQVVHIDRVRVGYSWRQLASGNLLFPEITLTRPTILLIRDAGGWQIASLFRSSGTAANTRTVRLPSIVIEQGTVTIEDDASGGASLPADVQSIDARLGLTLSQPGTDLAIRQADFVTRRPDLSVSMLSGHWISRNGHQQVSDVELRTPGSTMSGRFAFEPPGATGAPATVDTRIVLSPMKLEEFRDFVPALRGRPLVLSGSVEARGPLDALPITAALSTATAGSATAKVVLGSVGGSYTVRGRVGTTRLDLAPMLNDLTLASRLTSTDQIDLTFGTPASFDRLAGTVTVDSRRSSMLGYSWSRARGTVHITDGTLTVDGSADAYGANASVAGTIRPQATPVRYSLRGRVSGVDVHALPPQLRLPRLDTDLAGTYSVDGSGRRISASVTLDESRVEGAEVAAGAVGSFDNRSDRPQYSFSGHVANVDIERLGHALDIPAISTHRFASKIAGRVGVNGAGASLDGLTLETSAELDSSSIFGVDLGPANVTARVDERTLTTTYRGSIGGVEVGRLLDRPGLSGTLGGSADVRATVRGLGDGFDIEHVDANGTVSIEPSTVGPLSIDTARLEASLAGGTLTVTAFDAKGRDLDAHASGGLALGDAGRSNLAYHVGLSSLANLDPFIGHHLQGRVVLDGTVTGNRSALLSKGSAMFSPLKLDDEFDALTMKTDFDVRLPNLEVGKLQARVTADSTLVALAGRTISTIDATVEYAADHYQFDLTAKDKGRTLTATGALAPIDQGQEVTVRRATLDAGQRTWRLLGEEAQVRFSNGRLTLLQPVTLDSNGQEVSAEGTLALSEGASGQLDVTVSSVDLMSLGALLLSNRQLAGTLTGDARVTGGPATRNIVGNVKILAGEIDGYTFQSFDGLLNYRNGRADVDAILVQSPVSMLEASGQIPFSLARGALTDAPISLDITSSGVDLAVLEAAGAGLADVGGTMVVDAHVRGTGTAPVASGYIRVRQGAFRVAATGVRYTGAMVDVNLQGTELQIANLELHDGGGNALRGNGRLTIQNRALHDVALTVTGNDVTVLDNDLGRVSIDASLNLNGTAQAPNVAGLVRVHSARLEVDQILDRFGSAPYEPESAAETEPNQPGSKTGSNAHAVAAGPSSRPIGLDLTVQVPDDLVLRGRDLRLGGSALGLGDINMTAGGNFTLKRTGSGRPVLVGTITTVRGTYDFQGRRFAVERGGTIDFHGESPIDPALAIDANRTISGIVAQVMVGGTMRDPQLTLSSKPPLDQTDILSLILFNQPANRLGQGEAVSLGQRAAQLAEGLVASPLSNTLGRALNVDIFEVDPSADEGQGPAVTVGNQVGERLFVKFRQLFGARDVREFQLEYQLADFLRLQGSIAEGQTSAQRSLTSRVERGGIDLVVYFSY